MKQIYNSFKTLIILLTLLIFGANFAWGQTYHDGKWYSLYDEENHGTKWQKNRDVTINTYNNIFVPIAGNLFLDAKLEGNDVSYSSLSDLTSGGVSTSSSFADPQKWGVENPYSLTIAGTSKSIALNVTGTQQSAKIPFVGRVYYYAYSYNYARGLEVKDLSENTTSFSVVAPKNGTNDGHSVLIEYAKVPMKKHIRLADNGNGTTSITNVNLGSTLVGTTSSTSYHINLRSFLMEGTQLRYVSDNADFHFGNGQTTKTYSVLANSFAYTGGTANCASDNTHIGNPDNYEADIYFTPSAFNNGSSSATITIYDGNTVRATISVSATVLTDFYTKAVAHAVPSVGKVWAGVKGPSGKNGEHSRGWVNPGTADTYDWTHVVASSAPTYSYHYYKQDPDGYKFDGWYSNSACTSLKTSDAEFWESVQATTTEQTDLEYWAHWVPVTVNSVTPTSSTLTFTEPGKKSVTLTFNVSNADANADFNAPAISNSEWTLESWNYENNQVTVVVSFTVTNTTDKNSNHAATVTLTSKGTSDNQSQSVTVSVVLNMNPVFTCNISNDPFYVDDPALNLASLWTSTSNGEISYTIEKWTPSGINNEGATRPTIVNKQLSLGQAGTVELKLTQAGSVSYNEGWTTKTVTINKRANALTCDWENWSKNLATDDGAYVNFASDNAATPITVTPVTGTANATYYADQHAIYTSYNLGSATWTVAQAENYKYVAPTPQTLTVNIETVSVSCNVIGPLLAETQVSQAGPDGNGEIILPKAGSGDVLYFEMKKHGTMWGNNSKLTAYDESGNQLDYWEPVAKSLSDYNSCQETLPAGTARLVFAMYNTDDPYIRNIRISRREWLTIQDRDGNTINRLTIPTNTINGVRTASFWVDYSVCEDSIKVSSNNSHVTVSDVRFKTTAARKEITVSYSSDVPESIEATITVRTPSHNATVIIKAETEKQTPTLEWGSLYQTEPVSLPITFTDSAAVTASNDAQVTYSSDDESIVRIAADGLSFTIVGEGTAHLTATSAELPLWKSVSETKEINATNKKIQNIIWNQNFTRSLALSDVKELTAEVHVLNLATGVEEMNAERTALIQYTCPENNRVIEMVDGTHFRVLNYGETTITASVAGNDEFEAAASVTKLVRVREVSTGECEPAVMTEVVEELEFFEYDLSLSMKEISRIIPLDHTYGTPDKLNFYVRGVSFNFAIEYYKGGIDVYESTDGGSSWSEKLASVNPSKNTTAYSDVIQLSPNATHLKFVRPKGGQGYHYVGGISVTMVPMIEVENTTIDLGNIGAGSKYNGTIPVTYSNVLGDMTVVVDNTENGLKIDDVIEADCGTRATVDLDFSIQPMEVGNWSNTVTITDPLRGISVVVNLVATITQANQDIIWPGVVTTITPDEAPTLNAYATSGLTPVTYEVTSGRDFAEIVNGEVVISDLAVGHTFTITVRQEGNISYASVAKSWTFTVIGRYLFNGKVDDDWTKAGNWEIGEVPTSGNDVIIASEVVLMTEETVRSMNITTGSVTIAPTGGLTIGEGGISGATKENLILKADSARNSETKGQTGYLRISPEYTGTMPQATVELFSIAYYDMEADNRNDVGTWQFVGSPLANSVAAKSIFTESFIYEWDTLKGDWVNNRKKGVLKPFMGYSTSQYMNPDGLKVIYEGELVSNAKPQEIKLYYKEGDGVCHNMIANSYTAPIDITKFDLEDFDDVEGAIYLFNTGSRQNIADLANEAMRGETYTAPGQYIHIPINKVKALKSAFSENIPTSIAPMQGFCVHTTGTNPKITLDYSKLVWRGNYEDNGNGPLHVIARDANESESISSLCVTLIGGGLVDNLYLLESEENSPEYENGSDARKMMSGALNIFSVAGVDQLAVDATNSFIGTHLGIRSGEETTYTMVFSHLRSDNALALLDNETNETTDIYEGTEYTFFAEPNSVITDRFQIVERANGPAITTGCENAKSGVKVHKFIKDNQLFILKNGVLYNAAGVVVR